MFVFEFQARAAEQKVKPEFLVVSVVGVAAHGREFDAVVISRKLVFLAANERSAGKEISIDDILEIHGDLVDYMDDI